MLNLSRHSVSVVHFPWNPRLQSNRGAMQTHLFPDRTFEDWRDIDILWHL